MPEQKAYQLEPLTGFTPHEKNYIKALIREAIAEIPAPTPSSCNCSGQVDGVSRRISDLEARYVEDDKYVITRAKLAVFMKEEGIE
jgi:hypothetical protein